MTSSDVVKTHEPSTTWVTVAVAIVAAILVAAFMYGRANATRAEQEAAVTIKSENQAFCAALNIKTGSSMFAQCESGLTVIRNRQRQQWEGEVAGVF